MRKASKARGLLVRDRYSGIWKCEIEHVLIRNAHLSLQERSRDVCVRMEYARKRDDGILSASQQSIIVTQIQKLVYLPGLLLPLLHISLNMPSLETAFPRPFRLSARTIACSTPSWKLRFSSTAGVESGFEGAESMVVGRQVASPAAKQG